MGLSVNYMGLSGNYCIQCFQVVYESGWFSFYFLFILIFICFILKEKWLVLINYQTVHADTIQHFVNIYVSSKCKLRQIVIDPFHAMQSVFSRSVGKGCQVPSEPHLP